MSGISDYRLLSGQGRIHDFVKDLGKKTTPKSLIKFVLGDSKGNHALNQANIKRVTDLLEDVFESYQNEFDRSDIESLRMIQTILKQMSGRRWQVWSYSSINPTTSSAISKIDSMINTILFNYPMPNRLPDLILEYAPKEGREFKEGIDDARDAREGENIGVMTQETVSHLKDSQIKLLVRLFWSDVWERYPTKWRFFSIAWQHPLDKVRYETILQFFNYASAKQRHLFIDAFEKEFEARYFTKEEEHPFSQMTAIPLSFWSKNDSTETHYSEAASRYQEILDHIAPEKINLTVLHCRSLIKNLMNILKFVGDTNQVRSEYGKSCFFDMLNRLDILHMNKCDGLNGYFTAINMEKLKELSLQEGSAQNFEIGDFVFLSKTAPQLKILDLRGNQFSKEFEKEIVEALPNVNVMFGPVPASHEKKEDDGDS